MGRASFENVGMLCVLWALACTGADNEAPEAPETSSVDVPVSKPRILPPGEYAETHPAISYDGNWLDEKGADYKGGQRRATKDAGASLTFGFSGTGFVLYRGHGPGRGKFELCVDDQCRTVDNYGFKEFTTQPYGVHGLSPGEHRVSARSVRDRPIDVDGIMIVDSSSAAPLEPGRYQETHSELRYGGAWVHQQRHEKVSPRNGWVYTSLDHQAYVTFRTRGTGAILWHGIYDDRLVTELCATDAGQCVRSRDFSDSLFWRQPTVLAGLPLGLHDFKLTMIEGRVFDVEEVEVLGVQQPLAAGVTGPQDARLRYLTEWHERKLRVGDVYNETRQSRSPRATLLFAFEGSAVSIRVAKASDRGKAELCIDQACEEVQLNKPVRQPVLEWIERAGLTRGTHTVVLRKLDGRYLEVAGVRVTGG